MLDIICNYSLIIRDKKINKIVKSILIYFKNVFVYKYIIKIVIYSVISKYFDVIIYY